MKESGKFGFVQAVPLCILAVIRLFISVMLGIWYPAGQVWDDQLMVSYMNLSAHYKEPVYYALVKNMGWPALVSVFSRTGLPYTVLTALLWIGAAVSVFFLLKRLFGGNLWVAVIGYVYVLFMPQAFDAWSGTRFYRNSAIAPFVIITFAFMIQAVLRARDKGVFKVLSLVFAGVFFSLTYFLKEDGKWILACLLVAMLIGVGHAIYGRKLKDSAAVVVKNALLVLLPLVIFIAADLGYKGLNNKYFGVFEVNTRLESEFGDFCAKVYSVESPNRDIHVWEPYDAIEKVFDASPTLSEHKNLLNAIMTTSWCDNDIVANPIQGDHFAWILRNCLKAEGMYTSEADVKAFFGKVNDELDAAFKTGTLKKQSGTVQLFKNTGAFTGEEVKEIIGVTGASFKGAIFLDGYVPGLGEVTDEEIFDNWTSIDEAKVYAHVDYLDDYSGQIKKSEKLVPVIKILFFIYKCINVAFCLLSCGIILFEAVKFFAGLKSLKSYMEKNYKIFFSAVTALMFVGIAVCYAFSISWFSTFIFTESINMTILNFYNIALPGILFFANVFALYSLYHEIILMRGSKTHE